MNTHRAPRRLNVVLLAITAVAFTTGFGTTPIEQPVDDVSARWAYVLERTTTGDAAFDVSVSVAGDTGEENFIAMLGLAEVGHDVELHPVALYHRSGDPAPQGHVLGTTVGCPQAGCGTLGQIGGGALSWRYDSATSEVALSRVLIAVVAPEEPTISLRETTGWALAARPYDFHHVTTDEADSVGVSHSVAGADAFVRAQAQGFPQGSLAMAELPCSPGQVGVGGGVGQATLRGGETEPTTTCAIDYPGPVAARATQDTMWSFEAEGAAVGLDSSFETRLFVSEFPPPPACSESEYVNCVGGATP